MTVYRASRFDGWETYTVEAETAGQVRDIFKASQGWVVYPVRIHTLKEAEEYARANSKDR